MGAGPARWYALWPCSRSLALGLREKLGQRIGADLAHADALLDGVERRVDVGVDVGADQTPDSGRSGTVVDLSNGRHFPEGVIVVSSHFLSSLRVFTLVWGIRNPQISLFLLNCCTL